MKSMMTICLAGALLLASFGVVASTESPKILKETVPLVWLKTSIVTFRGHSVIVPPNVVISTDGVTFFYGTTYAWSPGELPSQKCSDGKPSTEHPMVLIDQRNCMYAIFPSAACSGTDVCASAMMLTPPHPIRAVTSGVQALTVTSDNYAQFGVVYADSSSSSVYGESSTISMSNSNDAWSDTGTTPNPHHYRWGGVQANQAPWYFAQSGTYNDWYDDAGTNHWHVFCYGWDNGSGSGQWQFFETNPTYHSGTAWHTYSVKFESSSSYWEDCDFDTTLETTHFNTWTNVFTYPSMEAITELAANTDQLDPAYETVNTAEYNPAIQYYDGSSWQDQPHETFYAQAWDSGTSGEQTAGCPLFNVGVTGQWVPYVHPDVKVGSGLTCQTSGSAW